MAKASVSSRTAALLLLLVLAAGTRFWGLGWGLPNTYHVDENFFAEKAVRFLSGDLNPHFSGIPTLHMYMLAGMWKVYTIAAGHKTFAESNEDLVQNPTPYYLIGRALSAVLGIGTVLLIFLLGLRIYNLSVGFAAGLFMAFSPEHVKICHAMLPDGPMLFLLVLTFYFIWRIYETGRPRFYILAGLAAGAAMAMKFGGHMLLPTLFLAHLLRVLDKGEPKKRILLHLPLYLAGLAFAAAFFLGFPYGFLDWKLTLFWYKWQTTTLLTQGHFGSSVQQSAWLFYLQYGFRDNLGAWVQFLAFAGIVAALIRRKAREWILLFYPVLLFLLIGVWKARATRYLLPAAPFFLLLAGLAAWSLAGTASRLAAKAVHGRPASGRTIAGLTAAFALIAVGPSAVRVVRYDASIAGPDTRTEARDWIHWNIPAGEKIALEMYDPPISREKYDTFYLHSLSDISFASLFNKGVRYAVISDINYARFTRFPDEFPSRASFYFDLARDATLIKSFVPAYDEDLLDLHNPTIKIYRLTKAPDFRFPGHFERLAAEAVLEKSAGGAWTLRASMTGHLGPYVGERVAEPYVLLRGRDGREIVRLVLHAGPVPDGEFRAEASREVPDPPEGARMILGYLYDLAPDPLRVPPEQPFFKDTVLPEPVDAAALSRGRLASSFRYEKAAPREAANKTGPTVLR
ncbi:MAG: glycosyltransferase family 39 protein [Candidatus Aminicenantes bacterium]|nr:glycosyltransferase family 39 protein [Candidatus Aminicenantes bacterium]